MASMVICLIFRWVIGLISSDQIRADLAIMWALMIVGQWTVGHPLWNLLQKKWAPNNQQPAPVPDVEDESDDEDVPL